MYGLLTTRSKHFLSIKVLARQNDGMTAECKLEFMNARHNVISDFSFKWRACEAYTVVLNSYFSIFEF